MKVHVCNICGGNLEIEKAGLFRCVSCGAISEVPFIEENQMASNIRAKLRMNDFDEAEEVALDALSQYPNNADINWLNVLSHYAIKYEKDYNGKEIPTCYALSYDSFLEDPHYLNAIKYGDKEQKAYYEKQGQIIEGIRKNWIEVVKSEPPYDIFISYKDKNPDGRTKTDDFHIALELYSHWKDLGYKVFFAHETLKGKVGEEYEPYIFNALNTAYCMVLIGTSTDNINSTWVKNEWTRYLKSIEKGQKARNSLVVAYKGFNASGLPRQLASIQALDINSVTFSSDLDNHIAKLKKQNSKVKTVDKVVLSGGVNKKAKTINKGVVHDTVLAGNNDTVYSPDDTKLLEIAANYFSHQLFDEAYAALDNVLAKNPNCGSALLTKFLFENHVANLSGLCRKNEITNLSSIEHIVANLDEETAGKFLDALYDVCSNSLSKNLPTKDLINSIIIYSYPKRKANIENLFNFVCSIGDVESFSLLLKALDQDDVDLYINKNLDFADHLLLKQDCKGAKVLYQKVIDVENGNTRALRGLLKCEINSYNASNLVQYESRFDGFENYKLIEDLLSFETNEEQATEIEAILEAATENCSADFLNQILRYYPYEVERVSSYVIAKAKHLCSYGRAYEALYYYNLLKDYNVITPEILWGIILCTCNCTKDEELVFSKTPINSLPEYAMYLTVCSSAESNKCIEILAKQKEYSTSIALIDEEEILMKDKILDYFSTINDLSFAISKNKPVEKDKYSSSLYIVAIVVSFLIVCISSISASYNPTFHICSIVLFVGLFISFLIVNSRNNKNKRKVSQPSESRQKLVQYEKTCKHFKLNNKTEFIENSSYNFYRDYNCHYAIMIDFENSLLRIIDFRNSLVELPLKNVKSAVIKATTINNKNAIEKAILEVKQKDGVTKQIQVMSSTSINVTRKLNKVKEINEKLANFIK